MPSGFPAGGLAWDSCSGYTSYQNVMTSSFSLHKICEVQQWNIMSRDQMHIMMSNEQNVISSLACNCFLYYLGWAFSNLWARWKHKFLTSWDVFRMAGGRGEVGGDGGREMPAKGTNRCRVGAGLMKGGWGGADLVTHLRGFPDLSCCLKPPRPECGKVSRQAGAWPWRLWADILESAKEISPASLLALSLTSSRIFFLASAAL